MTSSQSTADLGAHRGSAFGLAVDADFAIAGLRAARSDSPLPRLRLRLATDGEIARRWTPSKAVRISEEHLGAEGPSRTIDADPATGYRLYARYFGTCLISPDGGEMLYSPPPVAPWRWQRFLVGRCMPIAALLRGYEVLHASAVGLNGGVIALTGPRGAGKTSLLLHLALGGGEYFTDDALSMRVLSGVVVAHPGFGVLNVRVAEHERLGLTERDRLGALLGQTARSKLHYAVPVAPRALRLRRLYFLRAGDGGPRARIRALSDADPRPLLGSTFIHQVRPPESLARLLDVSAQVSATVPMFEIAMARDEGAAALAARLRAHAAEELAA